MWPDGTRAAESVIADQVGVRAQFSPAITSKPERPSASSSTVPASTPPAPTSVPGRLERPKALSEARSKVLWGDDREEVVRFLMMHGIARGEALELVQPMFEERATAIRGTGLRKIFTGAGMVCVPVAAYTLFSSLGVLPIKLFAMAVAVGLWGAWLLFNGILMLASPSMAPGDVADH